MKINSVLAIIAILISFQSTVISQFSWSEQSSGVTTQLTSVSAIDVNHAWICGYAGVVLRTTNGGTNWVSVTGAPIPNTLNLHCIYAIDSITALVGGSSATSAFIFRTSNAGASWQQVFTQAGGFINSIIMGTPQAGFMMGDPVGGRWTLFGTITAGLTWDSTNFYLPQNGSEAGWNNSMYYESNNGVWFGTNNTRIYKTSNLLLWIPQPTPGQLNSYALWFRNSNEGMTGDTALLYTSNGGTTWGNAGASLPGTGNMAGITAIANLWIVVRQTTAIYIGISNGINWNTSYTAPAGNYRHITKQRNNQNIFGVRTNGGITKGVYLTGIQPVSNVMPDNFELRQNYPNPFNPVTNISFDISNSNFVSLVVYDVLGREVETLVNENLNPGKYNVNYDASRLTSGVYYYKLTAGNFFETKKMILSK